MKQLFVERTLHTVQKCFGRLIRFHRIYIYYDSVIRLQKERFVIILVTVNHKRLHNAHPLHVKYYDIKQSEEFF